MGIGKTTWELGNHGWELGNRACELSHPDSCPVSRPLCAAGVARPLHSHLRFGGFGPNLRIPNSRLPPSQFPTPHVFPSLGIQELGIRPLGVGKPWTEIGKPCLCTSTPRLMPHKPSLVRWETMDGNWETVPVSFHTQTHAPSAVACALQGSRDPCLHFCGLGALRPTSGFPIPNSHHPKSELLMYFPPLGFRN